MSDNNNLPILREDNMALITKSAPQTYNENTLSCQRCTDFGQTLLDEINKVGMSDTLDQRCADYIEKAKRTLKIMNEKRSPYTKLFDQIRSAFTSMENSIDVAKKDTVPYLIQQARNVYAKQKHEQAERARQEEMRRQQHEQAITRYKQDAEDDVRRQFDCLTTKVINDLTSLNKSLTLENFDEVSAKIKDFAVTLSNDWLQQWQCYAHKPYDITDAEAADIRNAVIYRVTAQFNEQFRAEVGEYRDTIADALPSKKRELERMAQANAQEQARMKAELEAREAAETRRLDEERRRKEEEAKAAKAVQQSANEMDGLFAQTAVATPVGYQPKTSVKQKIAVDSADGVLAVVSMWWSKEGQFLSLEELLKIFKKQFTFCEKLANDKNNPEFINSPFIHYEEDVKAK